MKHKPICSLHIENLKNASRSLGGSTILGPHKSGLVHFKSLQYVKNALFLEEENIIAIKTEIPGHVLYQIRGEEQVVQREEPLEEAEKEEEQKELIPSAEKEEEVSDPGEDDENDVSEDIQEESDPEVEVPENYLTYEEVENMTAKELKTYFAEKVEGFDIPKSKNATETKELAHNYFEHKAE